MSEPKAEPAAEPTKRRSGWWFLAKLSLGLLMLVVGTLWFWVRSDGDLRTAGERIVAAGFPTTGMEMGRKRSEEARIKAWLRLDALFSDRAALKFYYSQMSGFAVPGSPLPADLTTNFSALPPAAVAEALMLIDGLGDEPVVLDVPYTVATRVPVISELSTFAYHHALVCPTTELPDVLMRFFRVERWRTPHAPIVLYSQWYAISRLMKALLYRRVDLTPEQRRRFADLLLDITANPGWRLAQAQAGGLVMDLDFYIDPYERCRLSGQSLPDVLHWPILRNLINRAGRGPLIELELDWAIFLRDHRDDLHAIVTEAHRRKPAPNGLVALLDPSMLLTYLMSRSTYAPYLCESVAKTRLGAELVAAVLRDEPWPVDWFDPTGARLRPITIDGKVTGAYSVGPDGVDDGGTSNKDVRWALFGPIDQPKP